MWINKDSNNFKTFWSDSSINLCLENENNKMWLINVFIINILYLQLITYKAVKNLE